MQLERDLHLASHYPRVEAARTRWSKATREAGTMAHFISKIGELRYFHPFEWFHIGKKTPNDAPERPIDRDDLSFLGMISMTPEPETRLDLAHLALVSGGDAQAEDPWLAVD
jgi:hypothetical protein